MKAFIRELGEDVYDHFVHMLSLDRSDDYFKGQLVEMEELLDRLKIICSEYTETEDGMKELYFQSKDIVIATNGRVINIITNFSQRSDCPFMMRFFRASRLHAYLMEKGLVCV